MVDLKTLIQRTLIDPKLLQLIIWLRKNQKEQAPEEISAVISKLTKRFGLFVGNKIRIPEDLKKQVVEALHFGQPGWTKIPAENIIFQWSGMRNDIEDNCSTRTACMSPGKNLK